MPRPSSSGAPASAPNKRKLTAIFLQKVKPQSRPFMVWDAMQRGLALRVEPTGYRAWKVVYRHHNRPRWYHIGAADAIGLADARSLAAEVMLEVARGRDPQAERKAARGAGTFEEVALRYREEHAKRHNKSWEQAAYLIDRYVQPRWGKLRATDVARSDVKAMLAHIASRSVANQTLAAASAIFSWAVREEVGGVTANPCSKVVRHEERSRERVLGDSEVPIFWQAFDGAGLLVGMALKVLLLTGQRPGEVCRMRREHIVDGWWTMPGDPDSKTGWLGTKNGEGHRVWLPKPVQRLLAELDEGATTGFVFAGHRGPITNLDGAMRTICAQLGIENKVTPHDLRRTHGTMVTRLGFGRDAMNRIQNHKEGGIGSVYDRHEYAEENRRVMEAVARQVMALAEDGDGAKVVPLVRR
jgi:integrase